MNKLLLLLLCPLLCLGWSGCGHAPAEKPEQAAETVSLPELEPAALFPTPAPEALLPQKAHSEVLDNSVVYSDLTRAELDAYAEQMIRQGLGVWRNGNVTLVYDETVLLRLTTDSSAPGYCRADWTPATGPMTLDPAALQALLPEKTLLCAIDITPDGMYEQTGLRLLRAAVQDGLACTPQRLLLGPEGCAPARGYFDSWCADALWADLDGDGTAEYVYRTPGPTSGIHTVSFWAYGLEDGFPVLKAAATLSLDWSGAGEESMYADRGSVVFRSGTKRYLLQFRNTPAPDPDSAYETCVWDIKEWDSQPAVGNAFDYLGASLPGLREKTADRQVYDANHCLLIRAPENAADPAAYFAALSSNRRTVTALVTCRTGQDGAPEVRTAGVRPIQRPADLDGLIGLSKQEVNRRLGTRHVQDGTELVLQGWFTEDGLLLRLVMGSRVLSAELYDPAADTVIARAGGGPAPEDPDEITADQQVPSTISNAARWISFLDRTGRGEEDRVRLRIIYREDTVNLELRYDREGYHLTGDGRERTYACLLTDTETDPPPQALFRSAVHFLLSDDPEMTHARYFSHLVSSQLQPSFPATQSLFTIYED